MSQTKVNDAPVDVMCTLFIWRILCFLRLPPLQIKLVLRKGEDRRNVFRLIMEYFVYYAPQLLFNEAIPAHPRNRATRVPLPGPIVIANMGEEKPTSSDSYWAGLQRLVQLRDLQLQPRVTNPVLIERLLPTPNEEETVENLRSSVHFSFLSEERLNAAVKLAKRDLRRWHRESLTKSPTKSSQEVDLLETTDVEEHQVTFLLI